MYISDLPLNSIFYAIPYILVSFSYIGIYYLSISPRWNAVFSVNYNIFLLLAIYFFFIGLRGYICTDWYSYYTMFSDTPSLTKFKEFTQYNSSVFTEPGYLLYIGVCKIFTSNYAVFQAISVAIDMFLIHCCLKKYSQNYIISFIILSVVFFEIQVNLNRNVKSILLFIYSLQYLHNKYGVKYIFINLIGVTFHVTSLLFIVLFFYFKASFSKKKLWIIFIISNLIFLFSIPFLKIILLFVSELFGGKISHAINVYFTSQDAFSFRGFSIGFLERTLTFIILIINYHKICKEYKFGKIFANMILIYLLSYLILNEVPLLVVRISSLFIFSYAIFYPYVIQLYSKKNQNIFIIIIFTYLFLRLGSVTSQLMYKYDNFMFSHATYEERARIFDYYGSSFLGIKE